MQNLHSESTSNKNKEEYLKKCTVAIRECQKGVSGTIGTGFIVTEDGLVITCYHVIGDIRNGKPYYKTLDVYFTEAGISKQAEIAEEYCNPSLDIAFLRLQGKEGEDKILPENSGVAYLSETIYSAHKFKSFGFRKPRQFEGLFSDIEILGRTREISINTSFSQDVLQLSSQEIEAGMSGSAVLDLETNRVIGIVFQHNDTRGTVDTNLNFAIPVRSILKGISDKIVSTLKYKNPGLNPRLSNLTEFLSKIRLEGELYQLIDDVYVPPLEYDDICYALAKNKIVFIVGTKEYGKTYTAIKLLWEYYRKGYEPKYIKTREEEKRVVRNELAGLIQKELTPKTITYFEDPFGKVKYQSDEELENEIGTIVDAIRNSSTDSYTIITSREEVFKDFEYKSIAEKLRKYEKSLNIKTPSYDYEKRKEMLLKWAKAKKCKWLKAKYLTNLILNALKDEQLLSSPLKIRDYAISTVGTAVEKELLDIMKEKSQETARSFANEIKEMEEDKMLFLMFPFISDGFSEEFIKSNYEILAKDLNIQEPWEYSSILDHFKRDKIRIQNNNVMFSHPSYSEAIKYIIYDKRHKTTKAGQILEKVLLKLADSEDVARAVSRAVADNFDKLSENVRSEALVKLADIEDAAGYVARAVACNFNKLPSNVQNLLFKLADNKYVARAVSRAVADNFGKLPENVRNELLLKLADKQDAAYYIADVVLDDVFANIFKQLPNPSVDKWKIVEQTSNLQHMIEQTSNLQQKLVNMKDADGDLASNFDKLPENVRKEVEQKVHKFDKLYEKMKKESSNFMNIYSEEFLKQSEQYSQIAVTVLEKLQRKSGAYRKDLKLDFYR